MHTSKRKWSKEYIKDLCSFKDRSLIWKSNLYQHIYNLRDMKVFLTCDLHSDVVSEHLPSTFIVHKVEIAYECPRTMHVHTILEGLWLYIYQLSYFTTMKEHFLKKKKKKAHQK